MKMTKIYKFIKSAWTLIKTAAAYEANDHFWESQ